MKTKMDFFRHFLKEMSIPLALWRSFEAERYSREKMATPILDVGCGDGKFAKAVFKKSLDAGVDIDGGEVSRAVLSGVYEKALTASVTDLPFADKSFNSVMSNCVLEHVPDIDKGLAEISRVLRKSGRLRITVPSEYYEESLFAGMFNTLGLKGLGKKYVDFVNWLFKHHHVDSSKVWEKRMKKAGLKLEKVEYLIPIKAYHAFEGWLYFAMPSKAWKILFGKWTILPRWWQLWFAPKWFAKVFSAEDKKGVCYFLTAKKM